MKQLIEQSHFIDESLNFLQRCRHRNDSNKILFAEVKESVASRRGVEYEVANGVRIPNLGEKKFKGESEEGVARAITAQVCDVNKALLSVRRVVEGGNKVVFEKNKLEGAAWDVLPGDVGQEQ